MPEAREGSLKFMLLLQASLDDNAERRQAEQPTSFAAVMAVVYLTLTSGIRSANCCRKYHMHRRVLLV